MRFNRNVILVLLSAAACARQATVGTAPAPGAGKVTRATITSADQLLTKMHDRYARSMYRSLVFVQKSSYLKEDGTPSRVDTWYEALQFPGRLRIDLGEPSKGNGVLYRNDSTYQVQSGKITDRRAGRNPLLVLGFDVYAQSPAKTREQLSGEQIDVTLLHVDSLDGRKMYVVGAGPRDTTSNQFWVDADDLLFRRLIQYNATRKSASDIRFEEYKRHGDAWLSEKVRVFREGHQVFQEDYSGIKVNVTLDPNLFIAEKWSSAPHWYAP